MKRIVHIVALLLVLAIPALATDITVSQHTLTNNRGYSGNIKLRIYFTGCVGSHFIDSNGVMIMCGSVGANVGFYAEIPVTLVGSTLTIPAHVLPSTDNASSTSVRATAVFYTGNTRRDNLYQNWAIPSSMGLTISMAQLADFNKSVVLPNPPASFLDAAATSSMIRDSSEAPIIEVPSGAVNSVNQTFTISQEIVLDSDEVYLNGVRQKRVTSGCVGGTESYTISGQTITHCLPPQTGDELLVAYRIAAPLIGPLDPTTRIREASGPSTLLIEDIADGECLRRSGLTIDGIACGGGGGGGGLADPGANGIVERTALGITTIATPGTDYLMPNGSGALLTALNATQLTSGTIPDGRFPAVLPNISGTNLTNLNAASISSGELADARLSANIPRLNAVNAFTSTNSFSGSVGIGTVSPDRPLEILSAAQPQLRLTHTDASAYSEFTVVAGGTVTLGSTGNIVFDATGNQIDPASNYDQNFGQLSKKYLTGHFAELWSETLVAHNTIATIGGRILVGPTTQLTSDLAPATTSISVKHNQMVSGDRVYLEANGSVEFLAITSSASGVGPYTYTVTRNLDGTGANQWYAGDAVFNTGTTGNGFIDIYSVRGVNSALEVGPTIVGNVRNSATYNDWDEIWAVGNLNGLYGYSANTYGAAFGKYAAGTPHITIDATNGYRTFSGLATVVQQIDNSGNIIVGQVAASQSNVQITAGQLNIRNNTTNRISLTSGGVLSINDSSGVSKISLDASAGMTLDGKLQMLGANSAIAIGTTPPTSAAAGTGIWLDRTGMYGLASSVLQAKFSATDGSITAGAGAVVLDANGLSLTNGNGTVNIIKFKESTDTVANIVGYRTVGQTLAQLGAVSPAADTTGHAQAILLANSNSFSAEAAIYATAYGSAHASQASKGHIVIAPSSTGGVLIGFQAGTATPAVSTLLELRSTVGVLLLNRLTTTERDALTPTDGMFFYNTSTGKFQGRAAGAWVDMH